MVHNTITTTFLERAAKRRRWVGLINPTRLRYPTLGDIGTLMERRGCCVCVKLGKYGIEWKAMNVSFHLYRTGAWLINR